MAIARNNAVRPYGGLRLLELQVAMKNDDRAFRELAKALDQLAIRFYRAAKVDETDVDAALNEIEANFVTRLSDEVSQIELRRRLAERKLVLLAERNLPLDAVSQAIRGLYVLGLASLERRATFEMTIADYHARNGRLIEARRILEELRVSLASSKNARTRVLYDEFTKSIDDRLRRWGTSTESN